MKNLIKKIFLILAIILLIIIFSLIFAFTTKEKNNKEMNKENNANLTISAVVVKVNENNLAVMETKNTSDLYYVNYLDKQNIELKKGQEILIYYDGTVAETYPAQISNAYKIEVVRENSDIQIPNEILSFFYSSKQNVSILVNEIKKTGITVTITDKNEVPYHYSDKYALYHKVKNENYTGNGYKIGKDTKNSTSGFSGIGTEYIWNEMGKISDISCEDTSEALVYNLPNLDKDTHYQVVGWKFDWKQLYGELEERRI